MRAILDQILSFAISGLLGSIGVLIRYSSMIRNEDYIKLKWFLADMASGFLLAGSIYSLLPSGWFKVPIAVFVGYMVRAVLSIVDRKGEKIIEDKINSLTK